MAGEPHNAQPTEAGHGRGLADQCLHCTLLGMELEAAYRASSVHGTACMFFPMALF